MSGNWLAQNYEPRLLGARIRTKRDVEPDTMKQATAENRVLSVDLK
jgi:hypothetical protein